MAQVKSNTLPPGRYWLIVAPIDFEAFAEWKDSTKSIRLETSELHQEDGGFEFEIFRVTAPVAYPLDRFGPVDTAPDKIQHYDDIFQAPDIHEPTLDETVDKFTQVGKYALAAAALIFLARLIKR